MGKRRRREKKKQERASLSPEKTEARREKHTEEMVALRASMDAQAKASTRKLQA